MKQPDKISWSRAAAAGLLFALVMCAWVWIDRNPGFDQLAIRFAAYFVAFTCGFYFLYNLVAGQKR
ncbi:MAG: hypothetical protein KJO02_06030 [Erythrobacter sp.]|nr:hypothetical protein [Erythrobacter sp.]NNC52039.1 hypothetical protein [Erythrobacter sp.]